MVQRERKLGTKRGLSGIQKPRSGPGGGVHRCSLSRARPAGAGRSGPQLSLVLPVPACTNCMAASPTPTVSSPLSALAPGWGADRQTQLGGSPQSWRSWAVSSPPALSCHHRLPAQAPCQAPASLPLARPAFSSWPHLKPLELKISSSLRRGWDWSGAGALTSQRPGLFPSPAGLPGSSQGPLTPLPLPAAPCRVTGREMETRVALRNVLTVCSLSPRPAPARPVCVVCLSVSPSQA